MIIFSYITQFLTAAIIVMLGCLAADRHSNADFLYLIPCTIIILFASSIIIYIDHVHITAWAIGFIISYLILIWKDFD